MNKDQIIRSLLIIFLLGDFAFSFLQYYTTPLFGDVDSHVLPDHHIRKVIDDPFGFQAIFHERHTNPNRFFSHYTFMKYMQKAPLFFQNFTDPISSVYFATALAKLGVQVLFVALMAMFISGKKKIFSHGFLLSAAVIAPLFQVYGFWSRMGINDRSIAYTFFYAIPIVFLMLFLYPIIENIYLKTDFKKIWYLITIPLVVALPLSGPLIPAVLILVSFLLLLSFLYPAGIKNSIDFFQALHCVPKTFYFLLVPACAFSLYSLFLGFYNVNYEGGIISLTDRFLRLPQGLYSQVFHALGFPVLLIMSGINFFLLKKIKGNDSNKLIIQLGWIGIFSILYILLLPFGGYRPYRPNIIRYDTFMPVTIGLIYFFGASVYFLLNYLVGKPRQYYSGLVIVCLLFFTVADMKGIGRNKCERTAFRKMAESAEKIVPLPNGCFIMAWENIYDYKQSENRAELIYRWGITTEKKLFYNEQ